MVVVWLSDDGAGTKAVAAQTDSEGQSFSARLTTTV
jgi:hypothetical protein